MRWTRRTIGAAAAGLFIGLYACGDEPLSPAPDGLEPVGMNPAIDGRGAAGTSFFVNGAQWTIAYDPGTSVGTGVINPYLGVRAPQATGIENGFNTDGAFNFNQHRTQRTNPLPLNFVPVINEGFAAREFVLDAHEEDDLFEIDEFEVWLCYDPNAPFYEDYADFGSNVLCELVYEIPAPPAGPVLATDQYTSGSGRVYDYRILIPETAFGAAAASLGVPLCDYDPTEAATTACGQYLINWVEMSEAGSTYEELATLRRPQVKVVKTPDAQTVEAGNPITFTIVVSNVYGTATGVTLNDPLPGGDGIDWSTSTEGCSITGSPPNESLTCTIGELGEGDSFEAVVTSQTTQASCAVYDNTATANSENAGSDDDDGQITVNNCKGSVKIVKNTIGGNDTFSYTGSGAPFTSFSIATTSNTGEQLFSNVPEGLYSVTESGPPAGWAFQSVACTNNGPGGSVSNATQTATIDVVGGVMVVCTFTNVEQAKITVAKTCVGGTGANFGYTGTDPSAAALTPFDRDCGESAVAVGPTTDFGTYAIDETTIPAGWAFDQLTCTGGGANTSTSGSQATVGLDAGEDVLCTYTNVKKAKITVAKVCVGGTGANFGYSGTDPDAAALTPFDRDCGESAVAVGPTDAFGTYTFDETTIPAGWAFDQLSCSGGGANTSTSGSQATVGLDAGEDVLCTYTNVKTAQITVAKVCVDGTGANFGYSGSDPDANPLSFDRDCGESAVAVGPTDAFGPYTFDETTIPGGWAFTGLTCTGGGANTSTSGSQATVGLDAGEQVLCTYTNTAPQSETAWAANGQGPLFVGELPYPGSNWATYVAYFDAEKTVDLFAAQDQDAGDVTFSAPAGGQVTITIVLSGWVFEPGSVIRIQDYEFESELESNPSPGQFDHSCSPTTATTATCVVPQNNFYGVHALVIEASP